MEQVPRKTTNYQLKIRDDLEADTFKSSANSNNIRTSIKARFVA